MDMLDTPVRFNKLDGQPIKQVWMSWWLAANTKVVRCPDEALPEIVLPDSIHDDA